MNTVPKRSFRHRCSASVCLLSSLALVLALFAGCMLIQPAAAAITLRFAISDGEGHQLPILQTI